MDEDVVALARAWIGTPYLHQASVKGVGCDCLGLIRGIWRARYGCEPEKPPNYTPDWGEYDRAEYLLSGATRHLVTLSGRAGFAAGQVLLFRMREGAAAKHLGLLSETGPSPRFIHAYSRHGVVESPLAASWRARIVARFRFP